MNIKPMLVRLEGAMDRNDLIEKMVLLPEPASAACKWASSAKSINLVVGYNASPSSQTALDLTMWIAHQTRLVTQKQVTVQVVYVIDEAESYENFQVFEYANVNGSATPQLSSGCTNQLAILTKPTTSVLKKLNKTKPQALATAKEKKSGKKRYPKPTVKQSSSFEKADRILWQARCLAEEWRGSFKAHLRFGNVATELRAVVEAEAATLLFLGCNSTAHPVVQRLGDNFPCSVLGIPTDLSSEVRL